MVTQQQLRGNWREIVGGIKQRWGALTDDELTTAEGDLDQLVGLIQRKSGETRQDIEDFLEHLVEGSGEGSSAGTARQYAEQARQRIQESTEQFTQQMQAGYAEADRMMRQHPLESVAVAFGAGLVSGLIVGLMIRPR